MTYLIVLSAMVLEIQKDKKTSNYILCLLFGTVSVITWFLTVPAAGLLILSLFLIRHPTIKNSFLLIFKDRWLIIALLASAAIMLLQLFIFQAHSSVIESSSGQLTVGSRITPFELAGSPLHISPILFGVIMALLFFFIARKSTNKETQVFILISTIPWIILVLFVYIYQNITVGYNSYYLTKVMGMSIIAALIPVGALTTLYLAKLKLANPRVTVPLTAVLGVGLLFIASGQPFYGANKLFQRNARTSHETSAQIVNLLPKTTQGDSYIVVFTNRKNYEGTREDYHGKLEINVLNRPLDCVYYITEYYSRNKTVERLAECADEADKKGKVIYVLTSPQTQEMVENLNRQNIRIIPT